MATFNAIEVKKAVSEHSTGVSPAAVKLAQMSCGFDVWSVGWVQGVVCN